MKLGFPLRKIQRRIMDFVRHVRESYYYLKDYRYEHSSKIGKIKTLLVIQEGAVGDTYNIIGFLNKLASKYSDLKIYILTREKSKDFYKNPRLVLITGNEAEQMINEGKIDALFTYGDISHYFNKKLTLKIPYRTGRLFPYKTRKVSDELIPMFKKLGFDIKQQEFYFTAQGENTAEDFYKKIHKPIVIFHIGSGKTVRAIKEDKIPSSYWPSINWAELADYLISEYDYNILFTGVKEENFLVEEAVAMIKNKKNVINAAGKYSIEEIASIARKSPLVVAIDSGLAHILAQIGVPIIILFAGDPKISAPHTNSKNVWSPKVCNSCRRYFCEEKNPVCINTIKLNQVIKELPWQ